MYYFKPTLDSEYDEIFQLMKTNMYEIQNEIGIEWNQRELENNYRDKTNYSVYRRDEFVGFVSLEFFQKYLFIHTLQIVPQYQNRRIGYRVFKFIIELAKEKKAKLLRCSVFENNTAIKMYLALGFREIDRINRVIQMELNLASVNLPNLET
jgi:ribosomal protein S18 acetylase RimI-like enzyme